MSLHAHLWARVGGAIEGATARHAPARTSGGGGQARRFHCEGARREPPGRPKSQVRCRVTRCRRC
eukprot:2211370-Pyramimonas_sp.AAC.1